MIQVNVGTKTVRIGAEVYIHNENHFGVKVSVCETGPADEPVRVHHSQPFTSIHDSIDSAREEAKRWMRAEYLELVRRRAEEANETLMRVELVNAELSGIHGFEIPENLSQKFEALEERFDAIKREMFGHLLGSEDSEKAEVTEALKALIDNLRSTRQGDSEIENDDLDPKPGNEAAKDAAN